LIVVRQEQLFLIQIELSAPHCRQWNICGSDFYGFDVAGKLN